MKKYRKYYPFNEEDNNISSNDSSSDISKDTSDSGSSGSDDMGSDSSDSGSSEIDKIPDIKAESYAIKFNRTFNTLNEISNEYANSNNSRILNFINRVLGTKAYLGKTPPPGAMKSLGTAASNVFNKSSDSIADWLAKNPNLGLGLGSGIGALGLYALWNAYQKKRLQNKLIKRGLGEPMNASSEYPYNKVRRYRNLDEDFGFAKGPQGIFYGTDNSFGYVGNKDLMMGTGALGLGVIGTYSIYKLIKYLFNKGTDEDIAKAKELTSIVNSVENSDVPVNESGINGSISYDPENDQILFNGITTGPNAGLVGGVAGAAAGAVTSLTIYGLIKLLNKMGRKDDAMKVADIASETLESNKTMEESYNNMYNRYNRYNDYYPMDESYDEYYPMDEGIADFLKKYGHIAVDKGVDYGDKGVRTLGRVGKTALRDVLRGADWATERVGREKFGLLKDRVNNATNKTLISIRDFLNKRINGKTQAQNQNFDPSVEFDDSAVPNGEVDEKDFDFQNKKRSKYDNPKNFGYYKGMNSRQRRNAKKDKGYVYDDFGNIIMPKYLFDRMFKSNNQKIDDIGKIKHDRMAEKQMRDINMDYDYDAYRESYNRSPYSYRSFNESASNTLMMLAKDVLDGKR